ncbi:TRAP transporter large permease [Pseudoprimorskyibacter insulae]|uniref:TRAP transporter large permease protein n=1 Tax=Pseudoprimorskyibacter insulae TaxID=1695997 RepID=A0A2R8AZS8_9RHOB|nr:TRAP transporter large permease [Pseudoprimorskyibacter insulae]SPF81523.1 Sialic acid TRAP transporter large permease protein SiaM [Pseudoprimorskyibacter insulae]
MDSIAILLGSTFVLMLLALPIAFAVIAGSIITLLYIGGINLMAIPQNLFSGLDSFSLLAIPFFVLAGSLMTSGGITERLLALANALLGRFRGGLAMSAVLSSALFAGISGSAVADTSALGRILIPSMIRSGYAPNFSAGLLAAANVMAPIIPPSIPFIVVATLTHQSIGTLFLAGVIPGLFYMAAMIFLAWWLSRKRGYPVQEPASGREILMALRDAFFALALPIFVLVGIRSGVFNITECAVVAALYALLVGTFVYRRITLRVLVDAFASAARTTAVIMIVVAAARLFSWVLAYLGIPGLISDFALENFSDPLMFLLAMNLLLLVVGMFIETNAAIVMLVPVLYPIALKLGVDPTHFSVLVVVNLCIGLITPPAGLCLNIATILAKTDLEDGVKGVLPFLALAIGILAILTFFPGLFLWFVA